MVSCDDNPSWHNTFVIAYSQTWKITRSLLATSWPLALPLGGKMAISGCTWHPLPLRNTNRKRGLCLSSLVVSAETWRLSLMRPTWVLFPSLNQGLWPSGYRLACITLHLWLWTLGQDFPKLLPLSVREGHFYQMWKCSLGRQNLQRPALQCSSKSERIHFLIHSINIYWTLCQALFLALGREQWTKASVLISTGVTDNKHNQ